MAGINLFYLPPLLPGRAAINMILSQRLLSAGAAAACGLCLLLLCSCTGERAEGPAAPSGSSPLSPAERVICASPGITEIVFALERGETVIGVSDYSIHPPEVRSLPRIGGLYNPNRERILMLQPGLVITQGRHNALTRFCRESGIALLSVPMDTLSDFRKAVLRIGRELEAGEPARRLVGRIMGDLDRVRTATRKYPARRVFLTLGHTPGDLSGLMTTGPGTFLHEIIEIAGGHNIFADAEGLYPQISKEALVMRQPEIILEVFPDGMSEGNRDLLKADWERLPMLKAVREGRVFFLTEDYLLIPGVRIGRTAGRFAELIHPGSIREQRP